jgi:signal transduction histidine kinase
MTDHRTLKPADFDDPYLTPEAAREAPADAPPATPFSKTWRDKEQRLVPDEPPAPAAQVLTAEHDAILGGEEYRDILRSERDEARAEVARLQEELKQARTRAIVGEHRNLLERLGKSSMAEATEDTLRTKLAETELRAEQAEQSLAALLEQIATEAPTRKPRHSGVCAPLRAELARERQRINDLIRLMRDCVDFIDRRELTGLSVPDQRAVRNTLLAVLPPAPKET